MAQYRTTDCTVTVNDRPAQAVEIRVAGELDRDAAPMLAGVTQYLNDLAPLHVVVELGELSFAGSALPNWLARIRSQLPSRPSVAIRHPQPLVRNVLAITNMADLVDRSRAIDTTSTVARVERPPYQVGTRV